MLILTNQLTNSISYLQPSFSFHHKLDNMEMEYSSSSRAVDTSLDLGFSSYFHNLHRDHRPHALPNHREEFTFPDEPLDLQVNNRESSPREEPGVLVKELNRIRSENKKLTEMLTCMCEKYSVLQTHFLELKEKNSSVSPREGVKRKARDDDYGQNINIVPNQITESSSCEEDTNNKRPKLDLIKNTVSRVLVWTDSSNINSLVVKDGYQWRKYGQKVTRDNPSPRAYFKCSFAPTCPVKKKVQRSVENKSVLVATYEGEHNHIQPCRAEFMFSTNQGLGTTINDVPNSNPSSPNHLNVDNNNNKMTVQGQGESNNKDDEQVGGAPSIFQQILVQQMASSLTKDPNFTAALAAAISGRVLDHSTSHL